MSTATDSTARIIGGLSRRMFGLEFDDLLALGCDVVRDTGGRGIALTFDDGPSTYATPAVLEALERHGARATFFMLGRNAARHPELVRAVAACGHAIGCHGDEHLDFHWASPWRIARDLRRCRDTLEDVLGRSVDLMRAPYGHFRWDVKATARRLGFRRLVGWSVAPAWNETRAEHIVDYVVARSRPGAIVLLHDANKFEQDDADGLSRAVTAALDPMLSTFERRGLACDSL